MEYKNVTSWSNIMNYVVGNLKMTMFIYKNLKKLVNLTMWTLIASL